MTRLERLRQLREAAMFYAQDLPDEQAAEVPTLYDEWKVGVDYKVDDRVFYPDKLYKCRQAHTSQESWTPDLTPAMWEVIDVTHAGTLEDPIPAAKNMEYTAGLYYLDPEDDKVYLCNRNTEIPVAYLPHELVGTYFEAVEQ